MNTMIRLITTACLLLGLAAPSLASGVSPEAIDGAVTVDTTKARALFDDEVAFVDVRKDSDWDAGRIPGSIHLDIKSKYNEENLAGEVKKDEAVVLYCNGPSCMRSSDASKLAVNWGYSKVHYYRDGFPAWKAAGNPVE